MATKVEAGERTSALSADEIVEYAERGYVRPGKVLTDEQVERLRSGLDRARERQQEYDLLDPELWPTKGTKEPGKSVGFLFNLWLQDDDFREVGDVIATTLTSEWSDSVRAELAERVRAIADRYPLYPQLTYAAAAATA